MYEGRKIFGYRYRKPLRTLVFIFICLTLIGCSGILTFGSKNASHIDTKGFNGNLHQGNQPSLASPMSIKGGVVKTMSQTHPSSAAMESSNALKHTKWWTTVQKKIRANEYRVRYQEGTYLPDIKSTHHAPNRAQNLRTYFTPNGIRIIRRTEEKPTWDVGLQLIGIGKGDRIITLPEDNDPVVDGTRIEYHRGTVVEWYENKPEGLEQGFTLDEKIEGKGSLSLLVRISGDIKPALSDDGQVVNFLTSSNTMVFRYGDLKTYDANGISLKSHFQLTSNSIKIVIADSTATYPIFIDPLITSPAWTAESNQNYAHFGISVATAGDVNDDGYSDVIVGAQDYDNGQTNEGKAFVYHGSASGLSTTAAWTTESNKTGALFGGSVGTAGDVNGDGYSDVIIGASE